MPSTTPSKRHRTVYRFTSSFAKTSITSLNALIPLLLLQLQWPKLLENSAAALATPLLPSLFIIQTTFIVLLCPLLPSTGKQHKKRGIVKVDTLGESIRAIVATLTQSLLLLIPSTFLLYTIIILFGMPLTTLTRESVLTAIHLSLLAIYPLSSINLTPENIRRLVTLEYHADIDVLKWTYWGAIGTLIGGWLGAVPMPLDWDRDWQKWPITTVTGAYIGHGVGLLLALAWYGTSTRGSNSSTNLESIEEEKKGI